MLKFGIELEYFITAGTEIIKPKKVNELFLETDDNPLLGEIRTAPDSNAYIVIGEVLGRIKEIQTSIATMEYVMKIVPSKVLTPEAYEAMLRDWQYLKTSMHRKNLYGKVWASSPMTVNAGLHVHFSDQSGEYFSKDNITKNPIYAQLDIPSMVRYMDKLFAKEITAAKRTIGEYELKAHGFEYRSLPNNVDLWKLAEALKKIKQV